jgi:cytochrome c biogenesis protein CcdA/PKD repeat protein/peroxiredoxin
MTRQKGRQSGVAKAILSLVLVAMLTGVLSPPAHGLSFAPDFTLTDINGTSFSLSDFRDQVVLLEFMRTWCTKCQAEVSELVEVQNEFGDLITIISLGIDANETNEDLRQFRDSEGIWWWPPHDWMYARCPLSSIFLDQYNVTSTPTMYILDQDGYIRYFHAGIGDDAVVDAAVLIAEIRTLLTYSVTIATSPSIDNVHFRIDGSDYYTTDGTIEVPLFHGLHQIELVDTMKEFGGIEYYFAQWSANASGSDNPLQINITSTHYVDAQFDPQDIMSPSADAGWDQVVNEDTLVTLDGSASTDNVGVTKYTWTFLDGGLQTLVGVAPTYTFASPGVYSVTLNATDAAGNWDADTVTLTVLDESQLIVDAGPDQVVNEDTVVTLNAYASWDPQGFATYLWTFLDETAQTLRGQTYNYTFNTPGNYTITLTATDTSGATVLDTVQITVLDVTNPLAIITMDHQAVVDRVVLFSAADSMDNVGIVMYNWSFGDNNSTTGVNANHHYSALGTYTVTLSITDAAGNGDTHHTVITVVENTGYFDVFPVINGDQVSYIGVESCCEVDSFHYDANASTISFDVAEETDTIGYANVSIPHDLLGLSHKFLIDNLPVTPIETQNSTHNFFFFKYSHSSHAITIVGTAGIMSLSGLSLVFSAGVLALFSPCGFPMLPGYLSYYLGKKKSIEKAVSGGVACTLGLIGVFSVIGVGVALFGNMVAQYIPVLELVAGSLAIAMGISMLANIKFPTLFSISRAPTQRGLHGLFLYGIAYGLATLGCSAPIFFSTLFYAISSGGFLPGIITFITYAIGMGLPLLLITILLARAKDRFLTKIMGAMPWIQKISSLVIIAIGIYLISYYLFIFA